MRKPFFVMLALAIGLFTATVFASWPSARAQESDGTSFNFVRDTEIEKSLRDIADPLLRAAGLSPDSVSIVLINSSVLNAFVANGQNLFFHTGLLEAADTPEQLAGVMAHEIGHIAGGHLIRGREAIDQARTQALLGVLLGVMAGLASGDGRAAAAGISASQELATRSFLSYSREQESAADSAALRFLDQLGWSSAGLMEFFEKLQGQELLPTDRQVEFVRTHPLTRDRIDAVEFHTHQSPYRGIKLPPDFQERHERMRAKLMGFLQPQTALLRYGNQDPRVSARYARAIALYRTGKIDEALHLTDGLIAEEADNPYFYELKGQVLFENSRIDDAVIAYRKAVALLPDAPLILAAYAHALIESKDEKALPEAILRLQETLRLEPDSAFAWRLLAAAWGRQGHEGLTAYALAEEAVLLGDPARAAGYAARAEKLLPKESPYRLRAQDIRATSQVPDKP